LRQTENRLRARRRDLKDDAAFGAHIDAIGRWVGWEENPQWKLPEMLHHAAAAGDAHAAALLAKMQAGTSSAR
jgi:hypothetical protein